MGEHREDLFSCRDVHNISTVHPQLFHRRESRALRVSLKVPNMLRVSRRACALVLVALALPHIATAQPAASRVLFRVFLADGRVLSSYGEWARLDDRVIFSMPTQLSREPVELHLVTIPSQRVDWPRTESYAESVRAAAYAATRGDADFAAFSSEVAQTLNEVAATGLPKCARHCRYSTK
jgi:hypothetical protein